ncbi:MAG: glycosyltransferase [Firmicutes bacterium]|nr:glycosyltransferase [Bacillota bacterium]
MEKSISVIIPNHNKGTALEKCLEAVFASKYENYEVIVVDDCSTDNSLEIAARFPCKVIGLSEHSGAARARNIGAGNSNGEILFFIDSDCLLQENTLSAVNQSMAQHSGLLTVIGGTYTRLPFDRTFFSTFQSIFVNYFETKNNEPDYIATHAMAIYASLFKVIGGFEEHFLPILEDVEFSHRLRRSGCRLVMDADILVQHVFNFSLLKSLRNALKKSMYWIMYSIRNRDLLADSGTASIELKINGALYIICLIAASLSLLFWNPVFLVLAATSLITNLLINRGLLAAFYKTGGLLFALMASLYYATLYPAAIWAGTSAGFVKYVWALKTQGSLLNVLTATLRRTYPLEEETYPAHILRYQKM